MRLLLEKVNMQKSSILFGPRCNMDERIELKDCLGIHCETLLEKYLGPPMAIGLSKEGCFKSTRERSWAKVNGCKGQGLSKTGREVLVQS